MATKLVIVESPAKAKTVRAVLGSDYEVEASVGHIRDLPLNGKGLPEEHRKKWWAEYAVDVEKEFQPYYEVPNEKSQQVRRLREAMKGKQELVLATDEDREGESIAWHLLEVLKPSKSVQVKRITFHEITKDAILKAIANPRQIDTNLVEAQEARRILDRLFGYTLSPVLWRKVTKNLSAGRVQTPAVKLIVEREEQRRRFKTSVYWGVRATLEKDAIAFPAELRTVDGQRIATGADFDDETGQLKNAKALLLQEGDAASLQKALKDAKPWRVASVEATEGQERPAPPFMTTTLQQDANRKFGFSADRTMRIAQQLYEGIDLGGESVGLITYMRTDSLSLANEAVDALRGLIGKEYADCLPDKPNRYASKVRNAQEAHEAIRPTDPNRKPSAIRKYLTEDQFKVYDLIWKRTVACQMLPARVLKTEVLIDVQAAGKNLGFRSSGKQILFDGFRRVYEEGREDAQADGDDRDLPRLQSGDEVACQEVEAQKHETKPPARYTDATLIKKLEDLGIGRPSTYASIIGVIVDRGYVKKQGRQLVPTWTAFMVYQVLEQNFNEFTDLGFTRDMMDELDEVAEGKTDSKDYLRQFFFGGGAVPGLKAAVDERKQTIPFPRYEIGAHPETEEPILVRLREDGTAFLQRGDPEKKQYANVPEELAPAELTLERALELFERRGAPQESLGTHPVTGRRLLLKQRGSYYLQAEQTAEEIERKDKPVFISLPGGVDPHSLSQEDLNYLCLLPRVVGTHPETGDEITFRIGKYGPYLQGGKEIRNVDDWRAGANLTVEKAVEILAMPKYARVRAAPAGPIQEFGELEGCAGPVKVLAGRFGPYVTDGETNATLPKGTDPATLSAERAQELLAAKRAAGPAPKRGRFTKAKKAPAKGRKK